MAQRAVVLITLSVSVGNKKNFRAILTDSVSESWICTLNSRLWYIWSNAKSPNVGFIVSLSHGQRGGG